MWRAVHHGASGQGTKYLVEYSPLVKCATGTFYRHIIELKLECLTIIRLINPMIVLTTNLIKHEFRQPGVKKELQIKIKETYLEHLCLTCFYKWVEHIHTEAHVRL